MKKERNASPGSGCSSANCVVGEQRLVHRFEHGLDQRLLGREVPADRADAHAGPARDLLDLGPQPELGEHGLGRGEHALAVAAGVGAHRPGPVIGIHVPYRRACPDPGEIEAGSLG